MERELRALVAQLERSWNKSDSDSFASVFAEDADFVHMFGGYYSGRATVAKNHRLIFDTIFKASKCEWKVEKLRPIGADAALVLTLCILEFQQGGHPVKMASRPLITAQCTGGQWQIVAFQNTQVTEKGSGEVKEQLSNEHPLRDKFGTAKA